jgi:hypothetical protein
VAVWSTRLAEGDRGDGDGGASQDGADGPGQVVAAGERLRGLGDPGPRGRERGEHREPEGSADLLRGIEHPGQDARVGIGRTGHPQGCHRGQRQPAAEAEQREQRQQPGDVLGVRGHLGEQGQRRRDHDQAGQQQPPGAEADSQPGRQAKRHDGDDGGGGEQAKAGLGRAVAEGALHVEGHDHLEAHRRADDEQLGQVRPGDVAGGEDAQR